MSTRSIVIAVAAVAVSPVASFAAQDPDIPTNKVAIVNGLTNLCLKPVRKKQAFFARQGECSGNYAWMVSKAGQGYQIKSTAGQGCLDDPAGRLSPTRVRTCDINARSQAWAFVKDAKSTMFQIRNVETGKCLEVTKARKKPGAKVATNECDATRDHQKWVFDAVIEPPQHTGQWSAPINLGLVAASAALDPKSTRVRLWSAGSPTGWTIGHQTHLATYNWFTRQVDGKKLSKTGEIYGAGLALDKDGLLRAVGGLESGKTFLLSGSDGFEEAGKLKIERGLTSLVTLANGKLFTLGGSWYANGLDKLGEVGDGADWTILKGVSPDDFKTNDDVRDRRDALMWLFATGGSQVFHAGPSNKMHWIDTSGNGSVVSAGTRGSGDTISGAAVMYEQNKILTFGGSRQFAKSDAKDVAHLIDLSGGFGKTPKVKEVRTTGTVFGNSVLLPDGTVAFIGGQKRLVPFTTLNSYLGAQLFDPKTETFRSLASMQMPRNINSVALLLPDGTVLAAGGGLCGRLCPGVNQTTAEILSPPYLFRPDGSKATRPKLQGAGRQTFDPGAKVKVTSDASEFVIVRMSATTRSLNSDQRRLVLDFEEADGDNDDVVLTLPTKDDGLVPGAYMLFGLRDGTPSIAETIFIR